MLEPELCEGTIAARLEPQLSSCPLGVSEAVRLHTHWTLSLWTFPPRHKNRESKTFKLSSQPHQLVFPLLTLPILGLSSVAGVVVHVVELRELHCAEAATLQV